MIKKFNDYINESSVFHKDEERRENIKNLFGVIFNFWKNKSTIKRDDFEELMSDKCRFTEVFGMGEGTSQIVFFAIFDESDNLSEFFGIDSKNRIARGYFNDGTSKEIQGKEFDEKFNKYYTRYMKDKYPERRNRFDNINMWNDDYDNEFSRQLFI